MTEFIGIMKSLGYPQTISMDSFRTPNFELVAECLHWLIMRYDPKIELDKDISEEARRISFVKSAVQIMLSEARIKLSPRRLYSADGFAVRELLKVATVLQSATKKVIACKMEGVELGPLIKAFDVKAARVLIGDLTKCGASLYDSLNSEPSLQESRSKASTMNTNMDEIERGLRETIDTMLKSISVSEEDRENAKRDEEMLQLKLEKRKSELERSEKRLSSLQNVRPAYMHQYDILEKELQDLFSTYSEKFRNLGWLRSQLEAFSHDEKEKLEEVERKMRKLQRRLHEEASGISTLGRSQELAILRGEDVEESMTTKSFEESDEEAGTKFWKWFDGGSFKTVLGPEAKQLAPSSATETSCEVKPGVQEWMRQTQGGLNSITKTIHNQEFDLDRDRCPSSRGHEKFERGKSPPSSLKIINDDTSESSLVSGDSDEDLLETDVIDPKDVGEDDSSDDYF